MIPQNARFKTIEYWSLNNCNTHEDILDLSRCLEDTAYKVIKNWHISANENSKPNRESAEASDVFCLINPESPVPYKTGWAAAKVELPLIAECIHESEWGEWHFEINSNYSSYVRKLYCEDSIIDDDIFLNTSKVLCKVENYEYRPFVYISFPDPQRSKMQLMMARISLTGLKKYNELIRDVAISLRAAVTMLYPNNYRNNLYKSGHVAVDNTKLSTEEMSFLRNVLFDVASHVNFKALSEKKLEGFIESLEKCRILLKPVALYSKRFTVHYIGHSHMDLAWKWRWPESVECMKGTLQTQLDNMKKYKDYIFTESNAAVWKELSESYPEFWEKCREAAENGQLEPVGGMWCEPDGQCLSIDSWFKQLLYGQDAAKKYLGRESVVGLNIDAFGFSAALPKILKHAGIKYFVTQKLRYNEFTVFPHILFHWESDDGSRILGLHVYPDHSNHIYHDDAPLISMTNHITTGSYEIPIMFGYGNHGGGPLPCMFERYESLKRITVYPNLKFNSFEGYFKELEQKEPDVIAKLPVVKDELFLETHHKTYTVQGRIKQENRENERRLHLSEKLSALASCFNCKVDSGKLNKAWEIQLFNQVHDVLPGTSFPSIYQDAFEGYEESEGITRNIINEATQKLFGNGNMLYVFNPLTWRRDAVVIIDLIDPMYKAFRSVLESSHGSLRDSRGNVLSYQKTWDGKKVMFLAIDLPALGFETYEPVADSIDRYNNIRSGEDWVDNGYLTVKFDREEGYITSMSTGGIKIPDVIAGRFDFLEDTSFRDYKTWNMGLTGKEFKANCEHFEKIEDGSVRVVFRAKYSFGLWEKKKEYYSIGMWHTPGSEYPTSFLTQDFIIYSGADKIECVLNIDWWEDDIVLKVAAETGLINTKAFFSVPAGHIERPVERKTEYEKARFEVPAGSWACLCGYAEGSYNSKIGIAIMNRSRHGYDALNGRLRLTLLASPRGDDRSSVSDPLADRGKHVIEYAFSPINGDINSARIQVKSFEYEYPVTVFLGGSEPIVPIGKDILALNPNSLIVTAVKKFENGGIVISGFEPYGKETRIEITGCIAKPEYEILDLLENNKLCNKREVGPCEIFTIRI